MTEQETGGAAFPYFHDMQNERRCGSGMTLRDYFAGQALIALMSNQQWVAGLDNSLVEIGGFKQAVAAHVYVMADAMLEARNK